MYPEDFGAAGNGTTDDTAAINAYIAYVKGLKPNLNGNFLTYQMKPNSVYLVSGPLNFGNVFSGGHNPSFTILGNGAEIIGTTTGPALVDCIDFGYGSSIQDLIITGVSGGAQGCGLLFGYSQAGTSGGQYGWSDTFRQYNLTIRGFYQFASKINRGADTSFEIGCSHQNQIATGIGIDIGDSGFCTIIDTQGQWPITSAIQTLMPLTIANPIRYSMRECVNQSSNGSPFWFDTNASIDSTEGYANSTGATAVPACVVYLLETLRGGLPRLSWSTHIETIGSISYVFYFYSPWASSTKPGTMVFGKFHWEEANWEAKMAALGCSAETTFIRLQDMNINASPQVASPQVAGTPLLDQPGRYVLSGTLSNVPAGSWSPPSCFNGVFYGAGGPSGYTFGGGLAIYFDQNTFTGALSFVGTTQLTLPNGTQVGTMAVDTNNGLHYSNQISGAAAAAGTLTNAPVAGNPSFWLPVTINGSTYYIPAWS